MRRGGRRLELELDMYKWLDRVRTFGEAARAALPESKNRNPSSPPVLKLFQRGSQTMTNIEEKVDMSLDELVSLRRDEAKKTEKKKSAGAKKESEGANP